MDIPKRLANRPRYKNIPIPYMIPTINGIPDFRLTDDEKWKKVATFRLCQLCGVQLGKHIYFIGGPTTFENRLFYDPPMHEDCARYALEICPYLARTEWQYSTRALPEGGYRATMIDIVDRVRPTKIGLFRTNGFQIVRVSVENKEQEQLFLLANEFNQVEWFE